MVICFSSSEIYLLCKKITRSAGITMVIGLLCVLYYLYSISQGLLLQKVNSGLRLLGGGQSRSTSFQPGLADRSKRGNVSSLDSSSSKCFRSPYILCPDSINSYDNIFYNDGRDEMPLVRPTIIDNANAGGEDGTEKTAGGLWKIAAKLRRHEPVVFNFINHPPEFLLPRSDMPCLRKSCVFRRGPLKKIDDVINVRALDLNEGSMPMKRWDGQLFLLDELESPINYITGSRFVDSFWRYQFNLTTTYMTNSDIFHPYNPLRFEPIPMEKKPNYSAIAAEKSKNVIWLVSNCHTESRREDYVSRMKKVIDVETFGHCGNLTNCTGQRVPCLEALFKPYRYYLAFENSVCEDYVTEKFFKVFAPNLHIVPVTLGKGNYSKYFPPKTFIDSGDFESPDELASHLLGLAANTSEYAEMLQAIDEYRSLDSPNHFCTMCTAVTSLRLKPRIYDLHQWLSSQCGRLSGEIVTPNEVASNEVAFNEVASNEVTFNEVAPNEVLADTKIVK